jgi:hypothetical protein
VGPTAAGPTDGVPNAGGDRAYRTNAAAAAAWRSDGAASCLAMGVLATTGRVSLSMLVLVLLLARGTAGVIAHRASRSRRGQAAGITPLSDGPAAPPPDVAWAQARSRFDRLCAECATYECDPIRVLRLPALADVAVPSTGRFVEALAEAQALQTDAYPGPDGHATGFVAGQRCPCPTVVSPRAASAVLVDLPEGPPPGRGRTGSRPASLPTFLHAADPNRLRSGLPFSRSSIRGDRARWPDTVHTAQPSPSSRRGEPGPCHPASSVQKSTRTTWPCSSTSRMTRS